MSFNRLVIHWGITIKHAKPLLPATLDWMIHSVVTSVLEREGGVHIVTGVSVEHIHGLSIVPGHKTISRIVAECKKGLTANLNELGIPVRWTDGYWAFSVSPREFEAVRRYVLNQRDHHANGYLLDEELLWFQSLCEQ